MAGEFSLNAEQINKLNEITNEGGGNYAAGYDYLNQQIQSFLDTPENTGHPDRQAYENTNYWLRLAAEINRNDPNSQANAFIRGVTQNGRAFDGKTADAATVQENSNIIGKAVIGDVKQFNRVLDIGALLQHDVQSALGQGGQTLAGWGGGRFIIGTCRCRTSPVIRLGSASRATRLNMKSLSHLPLKRCWMQPADCA